MNKTISIVIQIALLSLLLIGVVPGYGQSPVKHIGENKLYYGASYYPESWPAAEVDLDIERMKELNMNVVRMAEFAWASMEPSEGNYNFQWLHEIIDKLNQNGISVILGTPTATPPVWLIEKHSEILRTNDDGTRQQHGARKNYSFTSSAYQKEMTAFIERMAKEFGRKEGVIAWQTDNEFSLEPDYSEITEKAWHQWLKEKYGSIDSLNKQWNNVLWSQTYSSFDQVPMPAEWMWHNPSLRWNWKNFYNNQIVAFQDLQLQAIRKYSSLPITHDGTPGNSLNYEALFKDLDFMAVNNYHSFEAYPRVISNYDRVRGYDKGYHWLFETAPNNSGGGPQGQTWFIHQPVGSMKAALWMNFALGGQGALFWLWRQHWGAHEMVHGAVISSWNKPAANYDEIKALGQELKQSGGFLMQAPVAPAQIAVLYSHEAVLANKIEEYVNDLKYYEEWTYRFYLPVNQSYLHRDVIGFNADLSLYKVLFIPLAPIIPQELRTKLRRWVANGGTLILGPMSGYRTADFTSFTDHATGDLEDWMGVQVESRVPIGLERRSAEDPYILQWADDFSVKPVEASLWSEALSSESGKTIATYQGGVHDGLPAIVESKVQKGKVIYLGTDPGKEGISALLLKVAADYGIKPMIADGDTGVVMAPREGKNAKGYVLVNITKEPKQLELRESGGEDLLTGRQEEGLIKLEPFQVKVIRIN